MKQEEKRNRTEIESKNSSKEVFLAIGIITGFIFVVALISLYVSNIYSNDGSCGCVVPIPLMLLILSSLGVFVGSLAYWFINSKAQPTIKKNKNNINATLGFLEPDERKIFEIMIKYKEGIKQSDIEKESGFHKVKVHRTINKLLSKRVIEKEITGKSNLIRINSELKALF